VRVGAEAGNHVGKLSRLNPKGLAYRYAVEEEDEEEEEG
jgi:hypothetical protein